MIISLIIILILIYLTVSSYKLHLKKDNKILENLKTYEEKKIKQQKSEILGQKQNNRKGGEKKRTRMYHI